MKDIIKELKAEAATKSGKFWICVCAFLIIEIIAVCVTGIMKMGGIACIDVEAIGGCAIAIVAIICHDVCWPNECIIYYEDEE